MADKNAWYHDDEEFNYSFPFIEDECYPGESENEEALPVGFYPNEDEDDTSARDDIERIIGESKDSCYDSDEQENDEVDDDFLNECLKPPKPKSNEGVVNAQDDSEEDEDEDEDVPMPDMEEYDFLNDWDDDDDDDIDDDIDDDE